MLDGPIGGASFNNEFGRPNLLGYFRTFEQQVARRGARLSQADHDRRRRRQHRRARRAQARAARRRAAGPARRPRHADRPGRRRGVVDGDRREHRRPRFRFGAARQRGDRSAARRKSSTAAGSWATTIRSCRSTTSARAGCRTRCPSWCTAAARGARFDLRAIPSEEPGMSPREIWCNEAQERYVLAIAPASLDRFRAICERERCPFAVVGRATAEPRLVVDRSARSATSRSTWTCACCSASRRRMTRDVAHRRARACRHSTRARSSSPTRRSACCSFPAVADKTFLITIGDRTVGGLCARDPMVGPWQVPVADVAVTLARFRRLSRRGDGDRRAHAAGADRRAGVGTHGGRRGDHQYRRRARSPQLARRQALGQLDGAGRTSGRGRRAVRHGARGRAWSCARRSASAFRSARIRCRCARRGATATSTRR